jgi:rod shape-determining protein MreD
MKRTKGIGLICISLFVGWMFLVIPLPAAVSSARPLLILLIVLYWALYSPNQVGVGVAWVAGLLTDFLYGIMLGPYALGFAVSAYLMIRLNARLNMFPVFQQMLVMGMIVAGVQLSTAAIAMWVAQIDMPWAILSSIPTSMLCWPLVVKILDAR